MRRGRPSRVSLAVSGHRAWGKGWWSAVGSTCHAYRLTRGVPRLHIGWRTKMYCGGRGGARILSIFPCPHRGLHEARGNTGPWIKAHPVSWDVTDRVMSVAQRRNFITAGDVCRITGIMRPPVEEEHHRTGLRFLPRTRVRLVLPALPGLATHRESGGGRADA